MIPDNPEPVEQVDADNPQPVYVSCPGCGRTDPDEFDHDVFHGCEFCDDQAISADIDEPEPVFNDEVDQYLADREARHARRIEWAKRGGRTS